MRILHSTHSAQAYIPPPLLGAGQIVCGPLYPDQSTDGRVASAKTPRGEYDFAQVMDRIPREQRPELLVVRTDATMVNTPRNIAAARCPAVLVIGDTHHLRSPISRLLSYARAEPFEAIILDFTRQHAHFFIEAGLPRVYWLPGFNVRRLDVRQGAVDLPLTFVGQVGQWHLRRASLCAALSAAGLPLRLMQAPGDEARQIHARSRVNFNCSLNGDLNLRVLEVMASGGCLLTDRLSPQSGLSLVFNEDEHYAAYGSPAECIEKARALLADPQRAAVVARNARSAYEAALAPERIAKDFFALIDRGVVRPEFDLGRDKRSSLPRSPNAAELGARLTLYELLQELQRQRETTRALVFGDVDPRLVSDAADLPHILLSVVARGSDAARWRAEMQRAGVAGQVALIESDAALAAADCDLVIAGARDAASPTALRALQAKRACMLMLCDGPPATLPEPLLGLGLARLEPGIPLYARSSRETSGR